MRIAISAKSKHKGAWLEKEFNRCEYFHVFDDDAAEASEVLFYDENDESFTGLEVAQALVTKKIDVVITGKIGPQSWKILNGSHVNVYRADEGPVLEALENYRNGKLSQLTTPSRLQQV